MANQINAVIVNLTEQNWILCRSCDTRSSFVPSDLRSPRLFGSPFSPLYFLAVRTGVVERQKRVPNHAAFGAKKVLSSPKSAWQSRAFRCPETCRGAKEHRVEALKRTGVVGRRNVAGKASLRRYKQVTKGTP